MSEVVTILVIGAIWTAVLVQLAHWSRKNSSLTAESYGPSRRPITNYPHISHVIWNLYVSATWTVVVLWIANRNDTLLPLILLLPASWMLWKAVKALLHLLNGEPWEK